jgi:N6-adenosine-specific RNA methylase IME4
MSDRKLTSRRQNTGVGRIAVASLRADPAIQQRAGLTTERVDAYAELLRDGTELPPVIAFWDDTEDFAWLADGFHRFAAAQANGANDILCDVRDGGRRDAILYSVGANATHGLHRTREDKRRAVRTLLEDPEWVVWSDRAIAEACKVSHEFVRQLRAASPTANVAVRTGLDGRTIDTTRIGDTAVEPEPEEGGTEPELAPPARIAGEIRLLNCDVIEMLRGLDGLADLVIADPPWDYVQSHGASRADNHYQCLRIPQIAAHVDAAAGRGRRLALWVTCPLLGEWMSSEHNWGPPKTAGAWVKSREGDEGHYGQGYHWAGVSELVLVYTRDGSFTDKSVPLRNGWIEPPRQHSQKPVEWQAQWIRRWVPEGGLVVDLYAGLGSVAEAVILAGGGRRYIGAEIDVERYAAALEHIQAAMKAGGGQ